jgi:hypothetical protein
MPTALSSDGGSIGNGFAAVTFEVERIVKGSFGPKAIVTTNAQGSACGLELLGPARTGLLSVLAIVVSAVFVVAAGLWWLGRRRRRPTASA